VERIGATAVTPEQFYALVPRDQFLRSIRETETPAYLLFQPILATQMAVLRATLGDRFDVHFAVKANPDPAVLRAIRRLADGADVASARELAAALDAGFEPERIEFSGPGKSLAELETAAETGIAAINVESLEELDLLAEIAARPQRRKRLPLGLRVNPPIRVKTGLRMAGATQFGLSPEDLATALERVKGLRDSIELAGLHLHVGSQVLEAESVLETLRVGLELGADVARSLGGPLPKLNLGGGWGVTYFDGQKPLDLDAIRVGLRELLERSDLRAALEGTRLILEPGRFLVAEAGVYLTRVLYRKQTGGKTFLIVDGGMHHNYLLAGGMGQVIRRNFRVEIFPEAERPRASADCTVDVAGCLCTPQDVLAHDIPCEAGVRRGDYVVFFNSGAYGSTASPIGFLSHPPPGMVVVP
jgi:diaminopimelate decarboxylase